MNQWKEWNLKWRVKVKHLIEDELGNEIDERVIPWWGKRER